ncbi:MAG: SURF1 family protein [Rhodobacteraceae bacterium]|nr:SURF1 family protein [Paracoccaceae bacterium]
MRGLFFLSLVGGLGLLALLSLGVWQMQRMTWKEDVLATIDARIAADPVSLPIAPSHEQDRYRAVTVSGEIEASELHVFWVTKEAETGYRIISPLVTAEGRRILVDRGFVPAAAKDAPRTSGASTITGNLLWPDDGDWTTPAPELGANILYARDVPYMAERLNTEPVLVVVRTASPGGDAIPQPVTSAGIPNNHLQYAIPWFSLAVIWAAMTAYFLRRSRAKSEG